MAENNQETGDTTSSERQFAIQRIYVKDLSFETPNSPQVFRAEWEPDVNVELNTAANPLEDGVYEVVLSVTVTNKVGDNVAYLVEVQQAGIFGISGFEEQELGAMLHSYCPNVLFPYAREAVSDLIQRGSFPQLALAPINFDALYAQHLEEQRQKQGGGDDKGAVH
jgi:preprotein translocase subunit SecB